MIAARAENLAVLKILPAIGFSGIFHLSSAMRLFPFDIVASLKGERVPIDVTTGLTKSLRIHRIIASALGMSLYVLFIKPDLRCFYLKEKVESDCVALHSGELRKID